MRASARSAVLKRRSPILAAALLAGLAAAAHSRVFERFGYASPGGAVATRLGWDMAYQTTLRINGRASETRVYQSRFDLASTLDSLRRAASAEGLDLRLSRGRNLAWAGSADKPAGIRWLLLQIEAPDRTLVFEMAGAPGPSGSGDDPETPRYPNARPLFTAVDEAAGTVLDISRSGAVRADILNYFGRHFQREGWTPVTPPGGSGGLAVYRRGRDIYCLAVKSSGHSEDSLITVMRKELGRGAAP